jgi:hypothetical protein
MKVWTGRRLRAGRDNRRTRVGKVLCYTKLAGKAVDRIGCVYWRNDTRHDLEGGETNTDVARIPEDHGLNGRHPELVCDGNRRGHRRLASVCVQAHS